MSLSNAKPGLQAAILAAFDHALQTAKNAGQNDVSGQIRSDLAKDLTDAIHKYVASADVVLDQFEGKKLGVTLESKAIPGIAVSAAGTAGAVTGATTASGQVIHTGKGKLE
jgi:hypothetical protein